jgi:predicted metal-dependent HD superfamily phosphohydrolase
MKGYNKLRQKALDILNTELPKKLYYHGTHHSLNALKACEKYLKSENIRGEKAKLLRIGILLHDIGYTVSKANHEDYSLSISEKLMTNFGFSKENINIVKGLITATKKTETPKNILENIISDVDLDYLGGPDYYKISHQLFKELKAVSNIKTKNEWNKIQIKFLENHKYYTNFALKFRQPEKEKRLQELKSKLTKS